MSNRAKTIRVFRSISAFATFAGLAFILYSADALAGAPTTGTAIQSAADNLTLFPKLVSAIAYVIGAGAIAIGLFKMRDYSNAPQQVKISEPLKYLFAGGLLVASPAFAAVLTETFGLAGVNGLSKTGVLNGSSGPATRLDEMVVALMKDISRPLGNVIAIFAYIAGAILTVVGLHRLTKSSQEGPRGPSGMGTIGTFVSAAILLSSSQVLAALSNSIFGSDTVSNYAEIFGFTSAAPVDHAQNVVSAILAFMMLVGLISFLRGVFVLRGFSDGNSQMSLMGGLSHIIAGVLAINLGPLVNAIQTTLGVSVIGHGIRFTTGPS